MVEQIRAIKNIDIFGYGHANIRKAAQAGKTIVKKLNTLLISQWILKYKRGGSPDSD
jgi:hypothetical protein